MTRVDLDSPEHALCSAALERREEERQVLKYQLGREKEEVTRAQERAEKAEARVAELEAALHAWDALYVWEPFEGYEEEMALHFAFHSKATDSVGKTSGNGDTPAAKADVPLADRSPGESAVLRPSEAQRCPRCGHELMSGGNCQDHGACDARQRANLAIDGAAVIRGLLSWPIDPAPARYDALGGERTRPNEALKPALDQETGGERIHLLKTWPVPFEDVRAGHKTFEYRRHDRDYRVGDILALEKWDPNEKRYLGAIERRRATHLLPGGTFGVPEGYCIMSLGPEHRPDKAIHDDTFKVGDYIRSRHDDCPAGQVRSIAEKDGKPWLHVITTSGWERGHPEHFAKLVENRSETAESPLAKGDRVRWGDLHEVGTVTDVTTTAFVEWDNGERNDHNVGRLHRVTDEKGGA